MQGKMPKMEMIALMMAAVLTSPLPALEEEFHSFCGKAPPLVVKE